MLLYVRRDNRDYQGQGAQDGHLDCHTAPELSHNNNLWYLFIFRSGDGVGFFRAQELCESRGGRPGLPSLISLRFLWT